MTALYSLSREQVERLVELAGLLHSEAEACAQANHWQSATMLTAESVEAALLATVVCCEPELHAASAWPDRGDPPQRWRLEILVDVARRAGWLPRTLPSDVSQTMR